MMVRKEKESFHTLPTIVKFNTTRDIFKNQKDIH